MIRCGTSTRCPGLRRGWTRPAEEQRRRLARVELTAASSRTSGCRAEDRLTTEADLLAAVTWTARSRPQPGQRYVIGLDIGLKRDRTVAAVCHAERVRDEWDVTHDRHEGRARPHGGLVGNEREPGAAFERSRTGSPRPRLSYRGATVRLDPWQAIGSMQRLRRRGVRCEEFTFSSPVGRPPRERRCTCCCATA